MARSHLLMKVSVLLVMVVAHDSDNVDCGNGYDGNGGGDDSCNGSDGDTGGDGMVLELICYQNVFLKN